jgi:cation:H+ antiporter
MWITYVLFFIGFVLLIKGADWLVDGASVIGRKARIPEMVIGLTIVSFGTSLPELLVTTMASLEGKAELGVSNVLGSNIANILIILGLAAIVRPLPIHRDTYLIDLPISMFAILLFGFLANTHWQPGDETLQLTRGDGVILLLFFGFFLVYIFAEVKTKSSEQQQEVVPRNTVMAYGKILGGAVLLYFGGEWVVNGASALAKIAGWSEAFIGLTVVAVGTSLPELVTSAVAAYKGNVNIAVGNAIGSNIFNVLWILGFTSIISPIRYSPGNNLDIMMIIIASAALIVAVIVGKRPVISRWEGVLFILIYAGYVAYLLRIQVPA